MKIQLKSLTGNVYTLCLFGFWLLTQKHTALKITNNFEIWQAYYTILQLFFCEIMWKCVLFPPPINIFHQCPFGIFIIGELPPVSERI